MKTEWADPAVTRRRPRVVPDRWSHRERSAAARRSAVAPTDPCSARRGCVRAGCAVPLPVPLPPRVGRVLGREVRELPRPLIDTNFHRFDAALLRPGHPGDDNASGLQPSESGRHLDAGRDLDRCLGGPPALGPVCRRLVEAGDLLHLMRPQFGDHADCRRGADDEQRDRDGLRDVEMKNVDQGRYRQDRSATAEQSQQGTDDAAENQTENHGHGGSPNVGNDNDLRVPAPPPKRRWPRAALQRRHRRHPADLARRRPGP